MIGEERSPGLEGSSPAWSPDVRRFATVLLICFAAFMCLYGLHTGPPMGDHECINALAARNTLANGEWLIPRVNEAPLIRKTPLGVWSIAAAGWISKVFGYGEDVRSFTARLPSALAGFGTVLAVSWLGSMLYGFRGGLAAGFITAGSAAIVYFARNAQVDMVLTFFVTLSMACFWRGALQAQPDRRFLAAFYVAFALAMLAKAPLPLVMVGLSLAVYWLVTIPWLDTLTAPPGVPASFVARLLGNLAAQLRRIGSLWLIPGLVVFLVLFLAWPLYVAFHVDTAPALWRIEYLSRFTGDLSDKVKPVWYYVSLVFGLVFPYLLSLPEAVASPVLPRYRAHLRGTLYAFTWAIVGTVFLSSSAFKRPHYLLSIMPAYCLLLGPVIDRLFFQTSVAAGRSVRFACTLLTVLLLAGGIGGGVMIRREYPPLIAPYILGASAAVLIWCAGCWFYARGRRLTSFACLHLGVPILLIFVWPALSQSAGLNAETDALAATMKQHGIGPADVIYWVEGQPSFTLPFYHGLPVRRLISEVEVAPLRTGRREISEDVYLAAVRRLQERLKEEPPAHFVVSAGPFDLLARRTDISIRELFRLTGFHEDAEDELVVFTRGERTESVSP